jgi:hypothetical protein
MFVIECQVGRAFGGWLKGERRYPTFEDAKAEALETSRAERRVDATEIVRRIVRL